MDSDDRKIEQIKQAIATYPDFPIKNVLFRDIFSVLKDPTAFSLLQQVLVNHVKSLPSVQVVAALDSRGFLFGPLLALELHVPFVPIRKKGKLPGKVAKAKYSLEYGEDVFEMQEGTVRAGDRVLIVDDLLATGGSLSAACQLVEGCGGAVAECLVVMELTDLQGRAKVGDRKIHSLIQY